MRRWMKNINIRRTVVGVAVTALCLVAAACFSLLWTVQSRAETAPAEVTSGNPSGTEADDGRRVYDMAGILTDDEIRGFEDTIAEYRKRMKLDVVVVTTNDAEGRSARNYADDFYDQGGFGYSKAKNGVLFLIDMDNQELYISTSGDTIRLLTDQRIENMLDDGYEAANQGNYAGCVQYFLTDLDGYYKKGIESGQYNYDTETGRISVHRSIRWYEFLLAAGVAAFTAGSACLGVTKKYSMKAERERGDNYLLAYRADSSFLYDNQLDNLVNKYVTTSIVPRINHSGGGGGGFSGGSSAGRSSTHMSGGGRSHGGGGRKF